MGDTIEKDYNEPLTVGSKSVEHFEGRVILKVVAKTYSKHFNCEMLEVDYPGGGVFRKYVDYMKKTKTQVLLPSNFEGRAKPAEIMARGDDPRLTELPMTERDLQTLEKNLRLRLAKDPKFFSWNDLWQLAAKRVDILPEKVQEIEAEFVATGKSATTEDLVRKHFGLEASSDLFDLTCLSLSALLEKKYKKEFILLADSGWGKWHLKSILNAMPEGLALSAPMAEVTELEEIEKPEMSIVQDFPIKIYLTWREILSGGIKVPRSLAKELSHAREYTFTDPDENKPYTVYYFPNAELLPRPPGLLLPAQHPPGGQPDARADRARPPSSSGSRSRRRRCPSSGWPTTPRRTSSSTRARRPTPSPSPTRSSTSSARRWPACCPSPRCARATTSATSSSPIYSDPGLATSAHSLHFLRAYHLIDIVRQTTQEDVEFTLLNSPEFTKSDKKKGVFTYHEPYIPEEEAPLEAAYPEGYEEPAPEAYTPEEAALEAVAEELFGAEPETVRETPRREPPGRSAPDRKRARH